MVRPVRLSPGLDRVPVKSPRNMMRMVIVSALAMVVCLGCYAVEGLAPGQDAAPPQQDAPKKSDPAASPAKPGTLPPATDTDPLKIAAPQTDGTPKLDANAPVSEKTYVIG